VDSKGPESTKWTWSISGQNASTRPTSSVQLPPLSLQSDPGGVVHHAKLAQAIGARHQLDAVRGMQQPLHENKEIIQDVLFVSVRQRALEVGPKTVPAQTNQQLVKTEQVCRRATLLKLWIALYQRFVGQQFLSGFSYSDRFPAQGVSKNIPVSQRFFRTILSVGPFLVFRLLLLAFSKDL
jgi:hypothetical protein